jgi:formylglycine-generating enzyme required for sulfatase activity
VYRGGSWNNNANNSRVANRNNNNPTNTNNNIGFRVLRSSDRNGPKAAPRAWG